MKIYAFADGGVNLASVGIVLFVRFDEVDVTDTRRLVHLVAKAYLLPAVDDVLTVAVFALALLCPQDKLLGSSL